MHFITEIIQPLCQCYQEQGQEQELIQYLKKCFNDYPNLYLMLTIANYLQRINNEQTAIDFIAEQVNNDQSLRNLSKLINLYLSTAHNSAAEKLNMLQAIIQQLSAGKPAYCCSHCGFTAPILYWNCPGCHHWSSARPLQKNIGGG
ncbi:MAG: hypothetical protein JSR33_08920 [Proteobacteria bacterium]|nr:hypothetical protein [Pseudomonadota bacterium]